MSVEYACVVPHPPLIVPAVGRGEEKGIRATAEAFEYVARHIAAVGPDTIVLASPHSVMYADYIHISPGASARGDLSRFGAPQASVEKEYDTELVEALTELAYEANLRAGTLGEKDPSLDHGALVPLYFIEQQLTDYKLVRVSLSGQPLIAHYHFGQLVARGGQKAWPTDRVRGERRSVAQADPGRALWLCARRAGVRQTGDGRDADGRLHGFPAHGGIILRSGGRVRAARFHRDGGAHWTAAR